jgi:hypothetical protein
MFNLQPPRHISTLPRATKFADVREGRRCRSDGEFIFQFSEFCYDRCRFAFSAAPSYWPVWGAERGSVIMAVKTRRASLRFLNTLEYQGAWMLASVVMLVGLVAPALWNGFPLIFPDTGDYLDGPILGALTMGRSALYGLFLYVGAPFSFWPNVVLQSAIIIWLIVLIIRAHGFGGRPWFALGVVAMLTVCTSLPFFSAQLMPDILFPSAVLALYLLSFPNKRLALWEHFVLAAVVALAIASHMGAAGMCVAITAALWLSTWFKPITLARPQMWFAAASVTAGIVLCPASNLAITGNFAFTPGGSSFLFGRLIKDGIVERYLGEACPDGSLRLCGFKATLREHAGSSWLWDGDSPFRELGGWKGLAAEERAITWATLERYPFMHASTGVVDAVTQFFTFQTDVDVHHDEYTPTVNRLRVHFPLLFAQFMRARQQAETFDVAPLNYLHRPVAALSVLGLGLALLLRRRLKIEPEAAALCFVILLALAVNAIICGVFSDSSDRYQSRLVLLAPLAIALLLEHWRYTYRTTLTPPST